MASTSVVTRLFGPELAASGGAFDVPFAALTEALSHIGPIIGFISIMLAGFYFIVAPGGHGPAERTTIDAPWAPRFYDLRHCGFCAKLFDHTGRTDAADRWGFQRMMADVDQREESRTWILNGGFGGQRRRTAGATKPSDARPGRNDDSSPTETADEDDGFIGANMLLAAAALASIDDPPSYEEPRSAEAAYPAEADCAAQDASWSSYDACETGTATGDF